mmetsp:Transcript_3098/g.8457  ORF Transcript_3098/g.8457 Transcript_3098/m.8457 type:complete len:226 (-) Transcript_3098:124-801(-)
MYIEQISSKPRRRSVSVRSLAPRAEPLGDEAQPSLVEVQGRLVPLVESVVYLGLVLADERLHEGLVQLARALELGQEEPRQEPELEERVERYPRDEEVAHRFYHGEEGEYHPVREPLRGRVQAVRLQGLVALVRGVKEPHAHEKGLEHESVQPQHLLQQNQPQHSLNWLEGRHVLIIPTTNNLSSSWKKKKSRRVSLCRPVLSRRVTCSRRWVPPSLQEQNQQER